MKQHLKSADGFLAACGIAAPILFALAVVVLGLLREDYSHVSQLMSKLGEVGSPNMAGQNANFIVTGLLVLAFSFGLYRATNPGKRVKAGSLLVAVIGLGTVGAGVFPSDSSCPASTCNYVSDNGHTVATFIVFLSIPFAVLLFSRGLRRDSPWRRYRGYSVLTGIVALALLVLFSFSLQDESSLLGRWDGALQRLYIASWLQWIGVMAIRLFTLSGRSPAANV